MTIDRREMLGAMSAVAAAGALGVSTGAGAAGTKTQQGSARLRKIATEEACSVPEVANALRAVAHTTWANLDMLLVRSIYGARDPARAP